ncbi:O-methyltransferase [Cyathus striatus]|nr:O-methyltransferase [Cyathus striatus]
MTADLSSPLRLLGRLITSSIEQIEAQLEREGVTYPSLQGPFDPTSKAESALLHPDVLSASSLIIAAASQLIATVRHPAQTVIDNSAAFHLGTSLRAVIETNIVEIIRDGGSMGVHVDEVAKKTNTDPLKIARILRLLSNHYIFCEVSPDVFAQNRLSSLLDSGKPIQELVEKPKEKHTGTSGIAAFISVCTDEVVKGAAYLTETLTDPKTAYSVEPNETPWNIAYKTDIPLFAWYDKPENEMHQKRFSAAQAGTTKMEPADAILTGFDWSSLPAGSTVVDVGGGVGSTSLVIARAVPSLKFIIQDRVATIEDAKEFWSREYPEAIAEDRVRLQVHDFFGPQPITGASAFLLRFIMHDWADSYASKILKNLRAVATPDTKLVSVDVIMPYTCKASITDEIPGASLPVAPEPLLPSMGAVNNMAYWLDLHMHILCNSQDRTLGHFVHLAGECGWKVVQVHRIPGSAFCQYISVPV